MRRLGKLLGEALRQAAAERDRDGRRGVNIAVAVNVEDEATAVVVSDDGAAGVTADGGRTARARSGPRDPGYATRPERGDHTASDAPPAPARPPHPPKETPLMRRLAVFVTTCFVALNAMAIGAGADDDAGDSPRNRVVLENYKVGATLTKAKTKVVEDEGPSVAAENAATAFASCTDCRTVAAAIQVVMVVGPAPDYRPTNSAVAVNYQCLRCQTFAYANQVLLATSEEVDLSDSAEQQIRRIRKEVDAVTVSPMAFPDMAAELDRLTQQMVGVVQAEIDRQGAVTTDEERQRKIERKDD